MGSINQDMVARVPHLPGAGQTVLGHELVIAPGGKGLNQAVAAARLGASTAFVGLVGDDGAGVRLLTVLDDEGIDTSGRREGGCPYGAGTDRGRRGWREPHRGGARRELGGDPGPCREPPSHDPVRPGGADAARDSARRGGTGATSGPRPRSPDHAERHSPGRARRRAAESHRHPRRQRARSRSHGHCAGIEAGRGGRSRPRPAGAGLWRRHRHAGCRGRGAGERRWRHPSARASRSRWWIPPLRATPSRAASRPGWPKAPACPMRSSGRWLPARWPSPRSVPRPPSPGAPMSRVALSGGG